MSSVVDTLLIAALTSVAVTATGDLTVKPRLAARARRIQARHDYRDQLELRINNVLINCRRLEQYSIPPTTPDEARERIEAERTRWIKQLDDDTAWLIDNQLLVAAGTPWPATCRRRRAPRWAALTPRRILTSRTSSPAS